MELKQQLESEIVLLDSEIERNPGNGSLYMERGKLYHKIGMFDRAMNDFIKVNTLEPQNNEAIQYVTMIRKIFEYRYTDIYNP